MTLLSVLRSGDTRFLPLLLSKVHDVLPQLANPMLQTVPDTPNMCADVDIFDGFGNAGMGIPSSFTGSMQSNNGPSEFKEFKIEDAGFAPFDKRIEELGSPSRPESNENSPFTSPPILPSAMEFPGLADYGGFPNLSGPSMGNQSNMHIQSPGVEFKREFDGTMALNGPGGLNVRRPPLRQSSGGSYGMQIPRSVPEFHTLQHANSGEGHEMGMNAVSDLPFR